MRLVIDTNVLVSGLLKPSGPPGRILDKVVQGIVIPVYSSMILDEYEAVFTRRKFAFNPASASALLELITAEGWPVSRITRVDTRFRDEDDRPFYECAAAADCPLVTGNLRDFPAKGSVEILSPAELMRRLET
ncbi:MAG: putative toxin-antitoxin system toxin component, PIN family [Sulfuricaulis sp.]